MPLAFACVTSHCVIWQITNFILVLYRRPSLEIIPRGSMYLFSVQKNALSVAVAFDFSQLKSPVRPAQMVQCDFLTT